MSYHIRPERAEDFAAIHTVVRLAFEQTEHTDGDEHMLVERLRRSPEYMPELSLVAEQGDQYSGQILGHIMFTKVKVGDATALALAPLSVLPAHQGKGLGGALLERGHELARALGWDIVILLGHPAYYPRFGYKPATSFGIVAPFEVPEEAFMAISLVGQTQALPGTVEYSAAFFG